MIKILNLDDLRWRNVESELPSDFQACLVKFRCPECPINCAWWEDGRFHFDAISQCASHLEPDERAAEFYLPEVWEMEMFSDMVTHWCPDNFRVWIASVIDSPE